jgi:hypothetical protein
LKSALRRLGISGWCAKHSGHITPAPGARRSTKFQTGQASHSGQTCQTLVPRSRRYSFFLRSMPTPRRIASRPTCTRQADKRKSETAVIAEHRRSDSGTLAALRREEEWSGLRESNHLWQPGVGCYPPSSNPRSDQRGASPPSRLHVRSVATPHQSSASIDKGRVSMTQSTAAFMARSAYRAGSEDSLPGKACRMCASAQNLQGARRTMSLPLLHGHFRTLHARVGLPPGFNAGVSFRPAPLMNGKTRWNRASLTKRRSPQRNTN